MKTTMIDTHVLNRGRHGVRSPLDSLGGELDDGRSADLSNDPEAGAGG